MQFTFSHGYFVFTLNIKCLKIVAFSKRDDLKMNGSNIGLGKNDIFAICNYYSEDFSVANMEEVALTSHMKGKKHAERCPSDHCIQSLMSPIPGPLLTILEISLSWALNIQK